MVSSPRRGPVTSCCIPYQRREKVNCRRRPIHGRIRSVNLVSIAGCDPSAGPGVRLDLRVFERLGHRGYGVLTAVTVPGSRRGSAGVYPRDRPGRRGPVRAAGRGPGQSTASRSACWRHVGEPARRRPGSSSGTRGAGPAGRRPGPRGRAPAPCFSKRRPGRAILEASSRAGPTSSRPNLDEAGAPRGTARPDRSPTMQKQAAEKIHLAERPPVPPQGRPSRSPGRGHPLRRPGVHGLRPPARRPRSVHGTGCFLSSAILRLLGRRTAAQGSLRTGHRSGRARPSARPCRPRRPGRLEPGSGCSTSVEDGARVPLPSRGSDADGPGRRGRGRPFGKTDALLWPRPPD
ncbi:MAG: hypothetical protein MZV70_52675 [Desulfobacterales bacterium]|nr:hypothetical protein [Desulfobacterales bacterium]